ncbi:MAG TPA: mechanosensitive ion channel family protein [Verrucomicrobiae bacterium]|nr:mechanosensitive ion channel family protein [Verrucomicrobiae bacterium]
MLEKIGSPRVVAGCIGYKVLSAGRRLLAGWFLVALNFSARAESSAIAGTNTVHTAAARPVTWMTFGLDRIEFLRANLFGNPAWEYVAALLFIVLAFYFSRLLDYLMQVQLKSWTKKTATRFDDLLLELLRGPVKIISFVVLLHLGLRAFSWPDWAAAFISNGLKIVVACSLTYVGIKFVDLLVGLWQARAEAAEEGVMDMHLFPIIRKSLKLFVLIVAVLVTSQNLGMNITGLLASLSVGGLAVGLAAQDTLSNLFGAVAIFADRPFRVGDRIQLDQIDGFVEVIGLRSTRVRNLDGYLVAIPNKNMANANIINVSKRPNIKTAMNIGLAYDCPAAKLEQAMQIIEDTYRSHPMTADLWVGLDKFETAAVNILVIHWWNSTDFKAYLDAFRKLNVDLKRRLDEAEISFASPRQTVYLRRNSEWQITRQDHQTKTPVVSN